MRRRSVQWLLSAVISAEPAELIQWNLILYGTKDDPLASPARPGADEEAIRKIKTRDHDPAAGSIANKWIEEFAASGIVMPPDLLKALAMTSYKATTTTSTSPPTTQRPRRKESVVMFRHGDHQHTLVQGWAGQLQDSIKDIKDLDKVAMAIDIPGDDIATRRRTTTASAEGKVAGCCQLLDSQMVLLPAEPSSI